MYKKCFASQVRKDKTFWRQNWRSSRHLFRWLWSLRAMALKRRCQPESLKLFLQYKWNISKLLPRPNAFYVPLTSHMSSVSAVSWDFEAGERVSAVTGIATLLSATPTWNIEWRWSSSDENLPREPSASSNMSWISVLKPAWKVCSTSAAEVPLDKRSNTLSFGRHISTFIHMYKSSAFEQHL